MSVLRPTELEYERTIIEAAKANNWLVHAERAAVSKGKWSTPIKGNAGFPDLVMVHRYTGRVLIVELKRKPNKPSPPQLDWLRAFQVAFSGGLSHRFRVLLAWMPEDLDALLALLTDRSAWEV